MTTYGGQAVMEGVMMKGDRHYAVSINTKDGLKTEVFPYKSTLTAHKWLDVPILRGVIVLKDMLKIGYSSLVYSGDQLLEEEGEESAPWVMYASVIFSVLLAIGLFKFLPLGAATMLDSFYSLSSITFNIVDGVVKLGIIILYIFLIGRLSDIAEVFRYHGAEHKAVMCYESKKKLTLKNMEQSTPYHPRCGTTFILVVVVLSVLVYLFIPKTLPFGYNLLLRLALLPLVIGISFEYQRFSAKYPFLATPGLWLQRLTVNSPSKKHLRPAKAALEAVMKADAS